jgi:hypothetical protein
VKHQVRTYHYIKDSPPTKPASHVSNVMTILFLIDMLLNACDIALLYIKLNDLHIQRILGELLCCQKE